MRFEVKKLGLPKGGLDVPCLLVFAHVLKVDALEVKAKVAR